jgi:hypothetical protein
MCVVEHRRTSRCGVEGLAARALPAVGILPSHAPRRRPYWEEHVIASAHHGETRARRSALSDFRAEGADRALGKDTCGDNDGFKRLMPTDYELPTTTTSVAAVAPSTIPVDTPQTTPVETDPHRAGAAASGQPRSGVGGYIRWGDGAPWKSQGEGGPQTQAPHGSRRARPQQ